MSKFSSLLFEFPNGVVLSTDLVIATMYALRQVTPPIPIHYFPLFHCPLYDLLKPVQLTAREEEKKKKKDLNNIDLRCFVHRYAQALLLSGPNNNSNDDNDDDDAYTHAGTHGPATGPPNPPPTESRSIHSQAPLP